MALDAESRTRAERFGIEVYTWDDEYLGKIMVEDVAGWVTFPVDRLAKPDTQHKFRFINEGAGTVELVGGSVYYNY
ncbi:hypothetical protein ACE1TI_20715 [Alteribacillus sp. JSM 102045]|uniref:hypothetical protein n=1 Tax=Alteribacillus sp. JSM 102045 TaxID=1562101 RepID=UPI0035C0D129